MNKVHFLSNSNEWETPQKFFDKVRDEYSMRRYNFIIDIAASETNHKLPQYVTKHMNALTMDWSAMPGATTPGNVIWCNPPYGRGLAGQFIAKAAEERSKRVSTLMLLPARTDTKAWHRYILVKGGHVTLEFLAGRLTFESDGQPVRDKKGRPQPAPFPSALVFFNGVAP